MESYFGESDLEDSRLERLKELADVEALLGEWNVDTAKFDAPWKCDDPL